MSVNPASRKESRPNLPGSATDRKMFFITGASRSGTTLLSFVLRNHSLVFGMNEMHYFGEFWDPRQEGSSLSAQRALTAVATLFERQENGIFAGRPDEPNIQRAHLFFDSLQPEDKSPAAIFAAAACQLAAQAGKSIPCEQTPRNIFYADALLRLYPGARVVHMLRDPRAVLASQKQRWKRRKLAADRRALPVSEALRSWVNYHPYTMAELWSRATREAARLASHPRFTILRFEDLLREPEPTIRSLCERLDLEFEPSMLEVSQINSSHQSSVGGARRGFHTEAVDSWRSTLSEVEISIIERSCRDLMDSFGYPMEGSPARLAGESRFALTYLLHVAAVLAVNPRRAWIQFRAAFR